MFIELNEINTYWIELLVNCLCEYLSLPSERRNNVLYFLYSPLRV